MTGCALLCNRLPDCRAYRFFESTLKCQLSSLDGHLPESLESISPRVFVLDSREEPADGEEHGACNETLAVAGKNTLFKVNVTGEPTANCVDDGWTVIQSRDRPDTSLYEFQNGWKIYSGGFGEPGTFEDA